MDNLSDTAILSQSEDDEDEEDEEEEEDESGEEMDSDTSVIEETYYSCPWCDIRYKEKEHLLEHLKKHVDDLPKTSGKSKSSARSEKGKISTHVPSAWMPYLCEVCSKSFFTKSALQEHAVGHIQQIYTCTRCSRVFRSRTEWMSHVAHHPPSLKLNEYFCKNCGKRCFNFTLLKIHVKQCVHHYAKVCQSCLEICDNADQLSSHMTSHVQDGSALTGNKLYMTFRCMFCHWDFWSRADLTGHQILRKKDVKFKCSICSAQFCLRFHLDEHMFWHKKNEPFKCKYCPHESFETKQQLKDHIDSHDPLRPYRCRYCTKCFGLPSSLQLHVQDQHPKEQWQSPKKAMRLPNRESLKRKNQHVDSMHFHERNPETDLLQLVQETIQIAESGSDSISLPSELDFFNNAAPLPLTKQKLTDAKSKPVTTESLATTQPSSIGVNPSLSMNCESVKQPSFTYSRRSFAKKISSEKKSITPNNSNYKNNSQSFDKSIMPVPNETSTPLCPQMCTNDATASIETKFSALLFMILGEETARALGYYDRSVSFTIYDMLQCAGYSIPPPDANHLTPEELSVNIHTLMNLCVNRQLIDDPILSNNSVDTLLAEMLWMYMSNPNEPNQ